MAGDPFDYLNDLVGSPEDVPRARPKNERPPGGLVVPIRLTAAELTFRFGGRQDIIEEIEFVDEQQKDD